MKVAHVIQSIDPAFGGPSAVVMRIARAQAELGAEVSIVTASSARERNCFGDWMERMGPSANLNLVQWPGGWIHGLSGGGAVRELCQQHQIVHIHGVWNSLVARCLSSRVNSGARIVLAPHGMLGRWSMRQKKLKKIFAWKLWMRSALARVDRFHVLNEHEAQELHELLPGARVGVVPNGTDLPALRPRSHAGRAPYLLFLARLHVMKGADRLVDAFAHGVSRGGLPPELQLVIAGPDFGMLDELQQRTTALGLGDRVKFPGAIFGAEKDSLLEGALAVCQPSRHEGFSLTLLEALAHGIPVITTPEGNLPAILAEKCALVVNGDDVAALSSAMRLLVVDRELRDRMSDAGRRLVALHFTWDRVAERSLQLYAQCGVNGRNAGKVSRLSPARSS